MHTKTGLEIYQHIKQLRKNSYLASGKTETLKNKEDEVWVSYETIKHLIEQVQNDMDDLIKLWIIFFVVIMICSLLLVELHPFNLLINLFWIGYYFIVKKKDKEIKKG